MQSRCAQVPRPSTHRSGPRRWTRGGGAILLFFASVAGGAGAEELPKELAFGLPEPVGYQAEGSAAPPFCPLGVCQPRSRDSLWAGAGFALAALGSAWLGRQRSRDTG